MFPQILQHLTKLFADNSFHNDYNQLQLRKEGDKMTEQINYITTEDGSFIFYRCYGQGFPLFLLHGNNQDGTFFKQQIQAFSQHYQVFVVDSRNHGQSTNNAPTLTFQQMAADLHSIMVFEKITKANLLGFSDGANIALYFTFLYPTFVHRLILNAGNTHRQGIKFYARLFTFFQQQWYRLLRRWLPQYQNKLKILSLLDQELPLSNDDLTNLATPTLIIVGKQDVVKVAHSLSLVRLLPHATFVLVPNSGHRLAQTNAKQFNHEVLHFLGGKTT